MKNTPKLRFKEFSGDWESKKLGVIADIIDGDRGTNYPKESEFHDEEFCLFLNAKNVTKNGFSFLEKKFITKEKDNLLKKGKLEKEDVVLTTRGTVGNIAYFDKIIPYKNMRVNSGMVLLRSKNILAEYLYSYLKSSYFKKQVKQVCFGSAQPQLTVKGINNFKVAIAEEKEQEKIASFFSLIDNKIELQSEKVEVLKDYKKGMIQKIFSQELRFKDDEGMDYPDWEETKLGDITDIGTGSNDLQDKVEDGEYPFFVRSANIEKINTYTFDGEAILIPGDGNIGQIYHYINGKFAYHQRVYKISDFCTGVNGKYIYYYMNRFFLKEALKNSVKATVDSLRLPTLIGMDIRLPLIDEQNKIANFISDLDSKLEKEQEKLDSLNDYKKGLLQQMFI